jgi:hypothetical protein
MENIFAKKLTLWENGEQFSLSFKIIGDVRQLLLSSLTINWCVTLILDVQAAAEICGTERPIRLQ